MIYRLLANKGENMTDATDREAAVIIIHAAIREVSASVGSQDGALSHLNTLLSRVENGECDLLVARMETSQILGAYGFR